MNLPRFSTQNDWTPENIETISGAIYRREITTPERLKYHIGDQSKKKDINGNLTIGSQILGIKIGEMSEANYNEHQFYKYHTQVLKSIYKDETKITTRTRNDTSCLINFNISKLTPEEKTALEKAKKSFFTKHIYDFYIGGLIYDRALTLCRNNQIFLPEHQLQAKIINELYEIARLRSEENELFIQLACYNPSHKSTIEEHLKAEERELSSIDQLKFYLDNKDNQFIRSMGDRARREGYKKYMKYKNKYIKLKKNITL